MSIVPGVVVYQYSPIRHGCDLIAIIPPRHHLGIFWSVLSQPIVGLTKVVKDDPGTIVLAGSKYNGRGGVGFRCDLRQNGGMDVSGLAIHKIQREVRCELNKTVLVRQAYVKGRALGSIDKKGKASIN